MNTADKARVGPAADGPAPPEEEEEGEAAGKEPGADATPGPSDAFRLLVTRREPAVKLQYAVSGLEPLAWSEDHRVSVSTARSIAVLELICDVHNHGQDLVIHRTSVPAPLNSCLLKVSLPGPPAAASPARAQSGDSPCTQRVGRSAGGHRSRQHTHRTLRLFVPSVSGSRTPSRHTRTEPRRPPRSPARCAPRRAGSWRGSRSLAALPEAPPPADPPPPPDSPRPRLPLSGADSPRPLAGFVCLPLAPRLLW